MVTALDKNTALVIIDLQKGIIQFPLAKPVTEIITNVCKLIDAFRKAQLPIVIVNVNSAAAKWNTARKDSNPVRNVQFTPDWTEIIPEIKSEPGDIFITKHTWGAFFETDLDAELRKRDITGIVLTGIATSIGVEGTARHASERGYNITFAKDAMTDMFADAHEHSLKFIFPRIGEVDDTDKIIEKLA